jgi:hypothetical protein
VAQLCIGVVVRISDALLKLLDTDGSDAGRLAAASDALLELGENTTFEVLRVAVRRRWRPFECPAGRFMWSVWNGTTTVLREGTIRRIPRPLRERLHWELPQVLFRWLPGDAFRWAASHEDYDEHRTRLVKAYAGAAHAWLALIEAYGLAAERTPGALRKSRLT